MKFLTNNRPAPAPLTEAELNMSRNAGKCWAQARRWRELGDAKMADDLDARAYALIEAARGDDATRWQMAYTTAIFQLSKCEEKRGPVWRD